MADTPRGELVLEACADLLEPASIAVVMSRWPRLARTLVSLPGLPIPEHSLTSAVRAVDPEVWLAPEWADAIAKSEPEAATRALARVLPALIDRVGAHPSDAAALGSLLAIPAVRALLTQQAWILSSPLRWNAGRDGFFALIADAALIACERNPTESAGWVAPLIKPLIDRAPSHSLRSGETSLARLLGRMEGEALIELGVEVILRLRLWSKVFETDAVVLPVVSPLHRRLLVSDPFSGRWWWRTWDRAGKFRAWVAELWLDREWEPEHLVTATVNDPALLRGTMEWFADRRGRRANRFLRAMATAVLSDSAWDTTVRSEARRALGRAEK